MEKIKKYWKYLASAIGILAAYLLGRQAGTNRNIEQLRANNEQLKIELRSMESRLKEYRELNKDNEQRYLDIEKQLRATESIIKRSRLANKVNESDIDRLDKVNQQLREFIDAL